MNTNENIHVAVPPTVVILPMTVKGSYTARNGSEVSFQVTIDKESVLQALAAEAVSRVIGALARPTAVTVKKDGTESGGKPPVLTPDRAELLATGPVSWDSLMEWKAERETERAPLSEDAKALLGDLMADLESKGAAPKTKAQQAALRAFVRTLSKEG